jgi:hypothetical protein
VGHGFGHFHGHFFHGFRGPVIAFGPGFWWGSTFPAPWYYPYYPDYPYPSYYAYPPPPAYSGNYAPAPPASPAPPTAYYCQSAGAFYPDVKTCPENWVLAPQPPPAQPPQ